MYKFVDIEGEEYAFIDSKYKKELAKKKYEYLLQKSEIPKFYWTIEFSDYKGENSKDNLEKVIQYAKNINDKKFDHVHLYLYGNNNSQKTAIACNVGKEAIKKGLNVKFILAGSLIDKLIKVQGYSYIEEVEDEIKKIKNSDVLIIDDIFDPNKSILWKNPDSASLVLTAWDMFIREMVSSNTKMILTSNIAIDIIPKKFGESIYHLIDRNFICLSFFDDIKTYRKKKFDNLFDSKM